MNQVVIETKIKSLKEYKKKAERLLRAIKKAKSLANEIALFNLKLSVKSKKN
ncbi:MAG: hypothetical protein GXX11_02110 [Acholeplasmataceae bacterium]|nr:hypothetical protein [Acholeplasmataceae bacterium]